MPTRRGALAALGAAGGLAGCLSLPDVDVSLGEGDSQEDFSHPAIEITDYQFEFQGTIDAIDIIVSIANTGSEEHTVWVMIELFEDEERLNSGSFTTVVAPNRQTTEQIGNNGIILRSETAERFTYLLVSARVGIYESPFRPVAAYPREEIRELAGL